MNHSDDIDIDALCIGPLVASAKGMSRPPRRVSGFFLCGPVPWIWITAAGRLPGKALHVGLSLWFRAGRTKNMTVTISLNAVATELGFDRSTASRALAGLARAGLVVVEHGAGRNCSVTVPLPDDPARSTAALAVNVTPS